MILKLYIIYYLYFLILMIMERWLAARSQDLIPLPSQYREPGQKHAHLHSVEKVWHIPEIRPTGEIQDIVKETVEEIRQNRIKFVFPISEKWQLRRERRKMKAMNDEVKKFANWKSFRYNWKADWHWWSIWIHSYTIIGDDWWETEIQIG